MAPKKHNGVKNVWSHMVAEKKNALELSGRQVTRLCLWKQAYRLV